MCWFDFYDTCTTLVRFLLKCLCCNSTFFQMFIFLFFADASFPAGVFAQHLSPELFSLTAFQCLHLFGFIFGSRRLCGLLRPDLIQGSN